MQSLSLIISEFFPSFFRKKIVEDHFPQKTNLLCCYFYNIFDMRATSSQGLRKTNTQPTLSRPRTSLNKRSIDVYSQVIPLHRRIRRAYHMNTQSQLSPSSTNPSSLRIVKDRVDSDQPEAVYNWLD